MPPFKVKDNDPRRTLVDSAVKAIVESPVLNELVCSVVLKPYSFTEDGFLRSSCYLHVGIDHERFDPDKSKEYVSETNRIEDELSFNEFDLTIILDDISDIDTKIYP